VGAKTDPQSVFWLTVLFSILGAAAFVAARFGATVLAVWRE